jgi:hypothetical protein
MQTGVGPCAGDAVTVSANNVTIDLGGFKLEGNGPSGNAGIQINASITGTRIKHGAITNFGRGIEAQATATGTLVNKVTAINNSAFGILLGPATVKNSFASANGTGIEISGIGTGTGKIIHSVATRNTSDGLFIGLVATGLIDRSTSVANQNRGAFMGAQNGTVRRSKMNGNAAVGIDLFGTVSNTIDRVEAASNGGQGIVFESAAKHPVVEHSSALGNGKLSFEEGILINTPAEKASVTSTVAHGNFGDGIKIIATSAVVDGNTADGNGWGVKDGNNYGINSPTGKGHNHAAANDVTDNQQCVDDILC